VEAETGIAETSAGEGAPDSEGRRDLLDLSRTDLDAWVEAQGERPFRARQIWSWAYHHLVSDFASMTNLPAGVRQALVSEFTLGSTQVEATSTDTDGNRKQVLRLSDGETVEAVVMEEPYGSTVCVSSQVGCALGCAMCATGRAGFVRDLTTGEIVHQVVDAARTLAPRGRRVTNVVFMGMGEPLLNYEAVLQAIANLTEPAGLAINPQHITVSTIGLPERIVALAGEPYAVRLAVSLHGADDETRAVLVPYARQVSLERLLAACRTYARVRGTRITFEYVMAAGVNDSPDHARRLVSLIGGIPSHVNLIPLNPVTGCDLSSSSLAVMERFREPLTKARIPVTIRFSRGVDIGAGCGQLRGARSGPPPERGGAPRRYPRRGRES